MDRSATHENIGKQNNKLSNLSRNARMVELVARSEKVKYYLKNQSYPPGLTRNQQRTVLNHAKQHTWDEEKKELYITKGLEKRKKRVVMSVDEVADILKQHHSTSLAGHIGISATLNKISALYFWFGMKQDVVEYISACPKCQLHSKIKTQAPVLIPIKVTEPMQLVGMDLIDDGEGSIVFHEPLKKKRAKGKKRPAVSGSGGSRPSSSKQSNNTVPPITIRRDDTSPGNPTSNQKATTSSSGFESFQRNIMVKLDAITEAQREQLRLLRHMAANADGQGRQPSGLVEATDNSG